MTFLITRDARSTISVIVVAGACGFAAGTPLAILGGTGRAARRVVAIVGDDVIRFAELLQIARRCRRIIMADFVGTLAADSIGALLAGLGFLNPVFAALMIHVSSELLSF